MKTFWVVDGVSQWGILGQSWSKIEILGEIGKSGEKSNLTMFLSLSDLPLKYVHLATPPRILKEDDEDYDYDEEIPEQD